jgi:hypothetical protein
VEVEKDCCGKHLPIWGSLSASSKKQLFIIFTALTFDARIAVHPKSSLRPFPAFNNSSLHKHTSDDNAHSQL